MTAPRILYFSYKDTNNLSDISCINSPGLKLANGWTGQQSIQGNAKEMEYLTKFLNGDEWKHWYVLTDTLFTG